MCYAASAKYQREREMSIRSYLWVVSPYLGALLRIVV